MERGLILLTTTMMVLLASHVQGTSHLSFSNSPVGPISRTGCEVNKLCLEVPDDCDPSVSGNTCLFTSLNTSDSVAPNGTTVRVQLSGHSSGYIAMGLTVNSSVGTTTLFICGQNNSDFFFRTMSRSNTNTNAALTSVERRVEEIRGQVNGTLIQCEFTIPNLNSTTFPKSSSHSSLNFFVLLGNGTVNGNMLGPFNVLLDTGLLDISNVNPTATDSTGTTSGANSIFQSHVVMLLLTMLSLSFVKRA